MKIITNEINKPITQQFGSRVLFKYAVIIHNAVQYACMRQPLVPITYIDNGKSHTIQISKLDAMRIANNACKVHYNNRWYAGQRGEHDRAYFAGPAVLGINKIDCLGILTGGYDAQGKAPKIVLDPQCEAELVRKQYIPVLPKMLMHLTTLRRCSGLASRRMLREHYIEKRQTMENGLDIDL